MGIENKFGFIGTNKPVNITATRVLSKGVDYLVEVKDKRFHSENPKKTLNKTIKDDTFIDFKGKKHGTFVVIGRVNVISKSRNAANWLVKCVCGQYETRNIKSLKRHANENYHDLDTCARCADLKKIKRIASAKAMNMDYVEYCEKFFPRCDKNPKKNKNKNHYTNKKENLNC